LERREGALVVKKVEALIRPTTFAAVREALEDVGYSALITTEVQGHGVERGTTRQWVGMFYVVDVQPMTKVEVLIEDSVLEEVICVILENARTGLIGDGKILISSVDDAVSILTGERGVDPRG
jgi:nitrogen regulatory protein P-II 1